jgi:dienelactone hydrolase
MASTSQFSLSPSIVHHRLMRRNVPRLAFGDADAADPRAWQRKLRKRLATRMGYDHMPAKRCPVRPRTLWREEREVGSIEKLVFTSEPGSDVNAYFCLPRRPLSDPPPVFICLQGHSTGMHNAIGRSRDTPEGAADVEGDRDFALHCMRFGVAAMCIEQRGFGERRETALPGGRSGTTTCHDAAMHALMLGRTLAAERVYDVDRGIDYLHTRRDIDHRRIGIMGNSGGGLISILSGALLPRIAYMMPSCGFATYASSIMSIHHCVDNYIPGLLLEAEMGDVVGLFASKPLVVVAGKADPIFPVKGVREGFRQLRRIYEAMDAGDRCRLVIGPEGHRFYADLAWPVMLKLMGASVPRARR